MQYIQTSRDSYLFEAVVALEDAYLENELEFNFDIDQFREYVENDDYASQLKCLLRINDLHKLDKNSKYLDPSYA